MQIKNDDSRALYWLYQCSKGFRLRIVLLMFGNGVFAASFIWFALVCRKLIDAAVDRSRDKVTVWVLWLLLIIFLQLALRIFCNSMLEYVRCRLDIRLKQRVVECLLKKDYQAVSGYHSGELLNRLFSDVQVITEGVTGILPNLVNMVTRLIMAMGVMIAMDPVFTIAFVVAGIAVFLVTKLFRGKMKRLHKEVQGKQGVVRSFMQEMMEGLLIIKVFGIEEEMQQRMNGYQEDFFRIQMRRRTFSIGANAGIQFIFRLGYLYALCWGVVGLYYQTLTYGTLTAVLQMVSQVQMPFTNLSGFLPRIYSAIASAERLMELEQMPEEMEAEMISRDETYQSLQNIEFKNVSFSYGRNPVLVDASFRVKKGDFTAVTGLSGGGKSTLFLLLLGAYHPEQGEINLNLLRGGEILQVSAGVSYRRMFAYVPQGNYLFSGTLRENAAMLKPDATEAEIWNALKIACAEGFVQELPEGLHTLVGEHGFGFSEGQVQRLAIARAILGDAPVLLLDEATSALDEWTEARVLENIAKLKDKTCFIVTHRKAALNICNKILRIEDGRVREIHV